jgi:hypothetical protein
VGRRLAGLAALVLAAACAGREGTPTPTTGAPPATAAPTTTTSVPDTGGRMVAVYVPSVGDCFDVRTSTDGRTGHQSVHRLLFPCALPHEHEVYAVVTAPAEPASYPGEDALRKVANLECPPRFEAWVGQRYELSAYALGTVLPTVDGWPGQRTIGCTLTTSDGTRTTGSGRGSGK